MCSHVPEIETHYFMVLYYGIVCLTKSASFNFGAFVGINSLFECQVCYWY